MKISCIIPTYNRNEFLIEAVNSVLNQTFPPDEIIIVNNGVSSVKLPDEMVEKVSVYNIVPNAGVSQARNFGAALAKGDYLAFLDDDDLWSEKYLENSFKALEDRVDVVVSRLDALLDDGIKPFKNIEGKIGVKHLLTYNPGINGSNMVLKREAFFKANGFDVRLATSEDKSLLIELIKAGFKITVLPSNQAIIRRVSCKYAQLSNPETMADGIFQFTKKYFSLMNHKEKVTNLVKVYQYRYKSGRKSAILSLMFFYLINKFYSIINFK